MFKSAIEEHLEIVSNLKTFSKEIETLEEIIEILAKGNKILLKGVFKKQVRLFWYFISY